MLQETKKPLFIVLKSRVLEHPRELFPEENNGFMKCLSMGSINKMPISTKVTD